MEYRGFVDGRIQFLAAHVRAVGKIVSGKRMEWVGLLKSMLGDGELVYARVGVAIEDDGGLYLASVGNLIKHEQTSGVLHACISHVEQVVMDGFCCNVWDENWEPQPGQLHDANNAFTSSGAVCVVTVPILRPEVEVGDLAPCKRVAGALTLGWTSQPSLLTRYVAIMQSLAAEAAPGFAAALAAVVHDVTAHYLPYVTPGAHVGLRRITMRTPSTTTDDEMETDDSRSAPSGQSFTSRESSVCDSDPEEVSLSISRLAGRGTQLQDTCRAGAGQLPAVEEVGDGHHPGPTLGGGQLAYKCTITELKGHDVTAFADDDMCSDAKSPAPLTFNGQEQCTSTCSARGVEEEVEQCPMWLTFKDPALEMRFKVSRGVRARQADFGFVMLCLVGFLGVWRDPLMWSNKSAWITMIGYACLIYGMLFNPSWYVEHRETVGVSMTVLLTVLYGWVWSIHIMSPQITFRTAAMFRSPITMAVSFVMSHGIVGQAPGLRDLSSLITSALPLLGANLAMLALNRKWERQERIDFLKAVHSQK